MPVTVAGDGEVRLPGGEVVRAVTHSPAGSEVSLALRPEKVSLYRESETVPPGLNCLSGVVKLRIYVGAALYYHVDVGSATIRSRQENSPGTAQLAEGDKVCVAWDPASGDALEG